jgi:hypothetical protein
LSIVAIAPRNPPWFDTEHLRNGTPQEVVSDRANVSNEVLDQHYDERTEREKMQIRREFIKEI